MLSAKCRPFCLGLNVLNSNVSWWAMSAFNASVDNIKQPAQLYFSQHNLIGLVQDQITEYTFSDNLLSTVLYVWHRLS